MRCTLCGILASLVGALMRAVDNLTAILLRGLHLVRHCVCFLARILLYYVASILTDPF